MMENERLASIEAQMRALSESNARLERFITDSVSRLEKRLENWQDSSVPRSEIEALSRSRDLQLQAQASTVTEIAGNVTWLWRTVLSAIIVGFVGGGITVVWAIVKTGGGIG